LAWLRASLPLQGKRRQESKMNRIGENETTTGRREAFTDFTRLNVSCATRLYASSASL